MNIYCSNLPNDQDMIKALGSDAVPIPIAFGDCVFWGVSDTGDPIRVCIERKKIGDMVSCILDGRYVHQAQNAKGAGMDVLVLILEAGEIRSNPNDSLLDIRSWGINPNTMHRCQVWQQVQPAITYSRFDQYLTELAYLAGIIVKRSFDVKETAAIIKALWNNFQVSPDKHNSLKQIFTAPIGKVSLVRPGLVCRIAKEIDGVGWQHSSDVAKHFSSVRDMVEASESDWMNIPGIGKSIAANAVWSLNRKCDV